MDLFLLRVLLLFDKFTAWFKALTLKKNPGLQWPHTCRCSISACVFSIVNLDWLAGPDAQ